MSKQKKEEGDLTGPEVVVSLEVKNKEGEIIKTVEQEAHSWVSNYYAWLAMLMNLGSTQNVKDEFGKGRIITGASKSLAKCWDADFSTRTYLAIGQSDSSWDKDDHKLSDFFLRAGVDAIGSDPSSKVVIFQAAFTPDEDITVKETGILFQTAMDVLENSLNFYIERTVLDNSVDVLDGATLTVKYTISH